jgi:hypothetical protein
MKKEVKIYQIGKSVSGDLTLVHSMRTASDGLTMGI